MLVTYWLEVVFLPPVGGGTGHFVAVLAVRERMLGNRPGGEGDVIWVFDSYHAITTGNQNHLSRLYQVHFAFNISCFED